MVGYVAWIRAYWSHTQIRYVLDLDMLGFELDVLNPGRN